MVLAGPASADPPRQAFEPGWIMPVQDNRDTREQPILSLREIVQILRAQTGGGRPVGAPTLERGARPFYLIRWEMPNGEIRDFRVDAVSGQVR